jgi:hypothetical protein
MANPYWRPKPGEIIEGDIVEFFECDTQYGKRNAVVLDTDSGKVSVWLYHSVLKNQFEQQAPTIGSSIAIEYSGKHEKGYHLYDLVIYSEGEGLPYAPLTEEDSATIDDKPRHISEITGQEFKPEAKVTPPQPPKPAPVFQSMAKRTDTELAVEAVHRMRRRPTAARRRHYYPEGAEIQPIAHIKFAAVVSDEPDPFEWNDSPENNAEIQPPYSAGTGAFADAARRRAKAS